jgi:hypothetical protein
MEGEEREGRKKQTHGGRNKLGEFFNPPSPPLGAEKRERVV